MLGGYLALELPVPQRVQNHVTNLVEDQRARNYKRWRPKRIILLRHGCRRVVGFARTLPKVETKVSNLSVSLRGAGANGEGDGE